MNLEVMSIILVLEVVMVILSWTITLIFIFNEVLRRRLIKKIKSMGLIEKSIKTSAPIPSTKQMSSGGYQKKEKKEKKQKAPKPVKEEKQSYKKQQQPSNNKSSQKPKPKVEEKTPESKSDLLESMSKWGEF